MARAYDDPNSLRFTRREGERIVVALLLSAMLHISIWAGYHTGDKMGWWQKWHTPAWFRLGTKSLALQPKLPAPQDDQPSIFVDVSQADSDAPQHPKYYSNKNSHAANPDVANANVPKINGHQTDMPKTEDVPRAVKSTTTTPPAPPKETAHETAKANPAPQQPPQPQPLQPALQAPTPPEMAQTEAQAQDQPETPGETYQRQPRKTTTTPAAASPATPAQHQSERPRTLKQALAQRAQVPGQMMQQAGGVPLHRLSSSLDAKATPFGDYDAAIIEAVSQRWYDLLDSRRFAQDRTGRVTLRFKLKSDGTVIEMQTTDNSVGELLGYLCQEAIEEAAPFGKWPPDMVRMVGSNYREVTFTFYYY